MPKLLPLPLGVAVRVPLVPLTEAFQELCRVWPLPRLIATRQALVPLTAKVTLKRSPHSWPRVTLTVQPPPPPPPPPPPVVPSVTLELPELWYPSVAMIW